MSLYSSFQAAKNLGSAVGSTDLAMLIAGKDSSGNAATLKFGSTGGLVLDPGSVGGGGSSDASAANQVTGNNTLASIDGHVDTLEALLAAATPAGENVIGKTAGWGFDVPVAPTVSAGAYSPNDIMGALMTFTVARVNDEAVLINEIQIAFKSAVTPSLLLVLLEADPTNTTKTDNAAYSLAAADVFKVRASLPVNAIGGYTTDHGTPNTIRVPNLNLFMKPATGTRDIYMLLVDLTGVTLGSTSDMQVRVCGAGA